MFDAALLLLACGSPAAEPTFDRAPYADAIRTGTITDPDLEEISGMTVGSDGSLWGLSDSHNPPRLVRFGTDGAVIGHVDVATDNIDWEALSSFDRDGRRWLLVADTGDNDAVRDHVVLHVVDEAGAIAWSVRFRFPDGPEDVEAVAVDGETVVLITKRTDPPEVWTVPLAAGDAVATRIATIPGLPRNPPYGLLRRRSPAMATDLAIAPDGGLVALLTYEGGFVWTPAPGEDWPSVFGRPPARLPIPPMDQQEALCLGADGRTVWVTTEGGGAPLYRLDPLVPGAP